MIPSIELAQEQARRLAIVDEFGELERQIAEFKPKTERHKALKEQILSWYADLDGAATAQAEGRRYSVQIGTRQNQRTITKPWKAWALLRRAIGLDQVMELVPLRSAHWRPESRSGGQGLRSGGAGCLRYRSFPRAMGLRRR